MTREEHIENLKAIASDMPSDKCADWIESLMAGVKALEQEPCEDCISREKVSELLNEGWWKGIYPREAIMALPSVTPIPKIGKWKYIKKEDSYRCSLCGFPCHKDNLGAIATNYCAGCGAVMEV